MNFSNLLHWAIAFLLVALVAALLGFGGVAGTAMAGAKILFWVAIILAVLAFAGSQLRRTGPETDSSRSLDAVSGFRSKDGILRKESAVWTGR